MDMATGRDHARDVLRGLTALEMAFVNIAEIPWTNHSGYIDQPTFADTVFPSFAFLMGMSPTPARRSVGLIGLGLALNAANAFSKGERLRIPGVLQRLGVSSLLFSANSLKFMQELAGFPLLGLWYAISFILAGSSNIFAHPAYANADPYETSQTRIDRFCFGDRIYTPSFDPEGLLGALTTTFSMLIGQAAVSGRFSTLQQSAGALAMISLGEAMHIFLPKYAPISKTLWTPSFALVTSGTSIIKFLSVRVLTPYLPKPIENFLASIGRRSLEMYLLSTLTEMALQHGGARSIWTHAVSGVAQYTGRAAADFVLSVSFTILMGLGAAGLAHCGLRLRW